MQVNGKHNIHAKRAAALSPQSIRKEGAVRLARVTLCSSATHILCCVC
jgi:hypothetical protein